MRRFIFRLESVLNVRRAREEALQEELAAAKRAAEVERLTLEQRRERLEYVIAAAEKRRGGCTDPLQERTTQSYLMVLSEEVRSQQERVDAAELVVQEKNDLVVEAMQARKSLEKLKEKHLGEYRAEMAREETRQMDEIAARAS